MSEITEYKKNINSYGLIDWQKIKDSGLTVQYDSLHGTGSYVLPKLLNEYGIDFNEVESFGNEDRGGFGTTGTK